jgi:hypothetical protein
LSAAFACLFACFLAYSLARLLAKWSLPEIEKFDRGTTKSQLCPDWHLQEIRISIIGPLFSVLL